MRAHVENAKTNLPGWDHRKTTKPTAFMMSTVMTGIVVAVIDGQRFMLRGPGPTQLAFLEALSLGPPAFLDPRCRCAPIIPLRLQTKR